MKLFHISIKCQAGWLGYRDQMVKLKWREVQVLLIEATLIEADNVSQKRILTIDLNYYQIIGLFLS
jgi:hypothetical protein